MMWTRRIDVDGFEFVLFSRTNGRTYAPVISIEHEDYLTRDGFLSAFKRAFEVYPAYEADIELSFYWMDVSSLYSREDEVREYIQCFKDTGIEPSEKAAYVIEQLTAYYELPKKPPMPKKQKGRKPVAGWVYLLQSPTNHYKIGCATNPRNRAKTFGIQLPFEVEFLALIYTEDMYSLEGSLHEKFANKRVNGEWFALDAADVDYIEALEEVPF
jgi:hypothetical protein